MERSFSLKLTSIDAGVAIEEERDTLVVAAHGCQMERRAALIVVEGVDVGVAIEEDLDALVAAFHGCQMERREALMVVEGVNVGVAIEEDLDALVVAFHGCQMERRAALIVEISGVDVGTLVKSRYDISKRSLLRGSKELAIKLFLVERGHGDRGSSNLQAESEPIRSYRQALERDGLSACVSVRVYLEPIRFELEPILPTSS